MNRVMATRSVSLHDEHAAATRQRIVDAVANLIVEEHPASLSVPAIAARAGVSLRTVYRYFPTKEALIDTVSNLNSPEDTLRAFPPDKLQLDDLDEYVPQLWGELEHTRASIRAQMATPIGVQMAKKRAKRRNEVVERVLADEGVALEPDDQRRLVAMISMLMSRTALFELTDVHGLSVEEAARTAVWTTKAIFEAAQTNKGVGR